MIDSIRIKNLRSISDSGKLSIKPLTVLVGKNSCGKSTLARTFPLLRQSVEEKTRTPILWFGRYVDFGDFKDAVKSGEDEITFSFEIPLKENKNDIDEDILFLLDDEMIFLSNATLECSLTISQGKNLPYTKRICASLYRNSIEINANEEKEITSIKINDYSQTINNEDEDEDDLEAYLTEGEIIPRPHLIISPPPQIENQNSHLNAWRENESIWPLNLLPTLSNPFPDEMSYSSIQEVLTCIGLGTDTSIIKRISTLRERHKILPPTLKKLTKNSEKFKTLKLLLFAGKITQIFEYADSQISTYFHGIKYIEPLRATAERYYRVQDLAVDEIDPRGSNIAMYLKSLSSLELKTFNRWCFEALGFRVAYNQQPGHMAIKIKEEGNERNITDMGFGYSQLLPIAMHVWHTSFKKRRKTIKMRRFLSAKGKTTATIVVEQPELHLHPAFQAKIADIFCKAANNKNAPKTNIILETHSSHLINRLGELVSMGALDSADVQIVLFERDTDRDETSMRITTFDEDGFLNDWPVGFLQPEI